MFHQLTYDTFGLLPVLGEDEALQRAETRLGVRLPAAMREWYTRPDAISLASRQDSLLPLEQLKVLRHEGADYIHCMTENQGVSIWAVLIGAEDDPKVIINVDEGGWRSYCPHFSELIFGQIWDWYPYPITASAQAVPLRHDELRVLLTEFRAFPETKLWPGDSTFRLTREEGSLLLWSGEQQCDWNLHSKTAFGFQELLNRIWKMSNLAESLYGNDSVSKELLAKMRRS